MLHNGAAVKFGKRFAQVARCFRFIADQVEQFAPPAVCKSFKNKIVIFFS